MRRNGFDVTRMNRMNATAIEDCTVSTLALNRAGRLAPKRATSAPNTLRMSTHNSMEPSWLPHRPLSLYTSGLAECEFSNTLTTEKSDRT
jgi:hypothetical protein